MAIGLFWGSNEGNTASVADQIKAVYEENGGDTVELHNIGQSSPDDILKYDKLIFGISTWNIGELQDDWALFLDKFRIINFSGKTCAFFGLGDQFGYSDSFIDAVGVIADVVYDNGGEIVGFWPTDGYQFTGSVAHIEGMGEFYGLALDQDNESGKTPDRLKKWVEQLKKEFAGELV